MNRDALIAQLIRHEGLKPKPYTDTVGKKTIGIGRNLDNVGISKDEAIYLCGNDITHAEQIATQYDWYAKLNEARQNVVLNMIFNLGQTRFGGFLNMIGAIAKGDYDVAANHMMSSKWAAQVGKRAEELATQMRTGEL